MHSSKQPTLLFINVALNLATLSKGALGRLKLANVPDHIVLGLESFENKLSVTLLEVAFITWLATTLWMADSLVKNDDGLALAHSFNTGENSQYLTSF